jgi:nitroreductase
MGAATTMGFDGPADARLVTAALASVARTAGYAPSIHNTQPWRWRIRTPHLELSADRRRQLAVSDPEGRLLAVSCGAALHHARVGLAAEGWHVDIERVPEQGGPDLLARITVTGRTPVTPLAMRLLQTIRIRHTDRRPVTAAAPVEALDQIRQTVEGEGSHLHLLRRDDVLTLAAVAARAQKAESLDPLWRAELAYWAGGEREYGAGVPAESIPTAPPQTTVPGRDFAVTGTLPVSAEHDQGAAFAILYGDQDTRLGWLKGGEALSAAWLVATELDISVLPLSASVEVAGTRQALRHMLADVGQPFLVLRFGVADPDHAGPPHTPRLPAEQLVEIVEPPA